MAAKLFALSLSPVPPGYTHWNAELLREKAIEKGIAEFITAQVLYEVLKRQEQADQRLREAEKIVVLSLSPPPPGHKRWTPGLLRQRAAELGIDEFIAAAAAPEILRQLAAHGQWNRKRLPPYYRIELKPGEKERLLAIAARTGDPDGGPAWYLPRKIRYVEILLKLAEQVDLGDGEVRWYNGKNIAEQCGCSKDLVHKVRRICVREGLDGVLDRGRCVKR
jgi:hypothetical protein